MTALYSPSLSPAQWGSRSLRTQASADNLPPFDPSRSKAPTALTSPNKPRFNLSSVIRFGTKSKKNRPADIIQDPPDELYAIPIPISAPASKLQHKASDLNLESNTNPRFSRGVSSTSGTSRASTDGPLTPLDDFRISYQHSLMTLSDGVDPFTASGKPGTIDEKRQSTHSDKSLKRRIKDRLSGDRDPNKSTFLAGSRSKPSDSSVSPITNTGRNEKQHVKERSSTNTSSRARSNILAEMSPDKQLGRAEAINQESLNTPLTSAVSFQHPFVLAEAIPATLLDAHASAHPRKLSDSTYYSYSSFGTTMSSISRTPTILSTSTSKSAPAPELNFVSPIKSRFMRKSVSTYSSAPPLSKQSSMVSLKVSTSQGNLKRAGPGSILREGSSSGTASPRTNSPHPPPTSSLPPTPSESEEQPDIRSLSSSPSLHRATSNSAVTTSIRQQSPIPPTSASGSTQNLHLTPTLKPVASGSTVSLSTISSLAFAARPSTYGGSTTGGRSRSVSRAGSTSTSIAEREQESLSPSNNGTGAKGLESMIDMTEDSEEEESEIEFGDEEDILRNNDVLRNVSQRSTATTTPSTVSNTVPLLPSSPEKHAPTSANRSFVRTLTSSTANALRKQRSFHNPTSASSNVPNNSVSATASTTSTTPPFSPVSSPVRVQNPNPPTNSHSPSHRYISHPSHPSSTVANQQESNQVQILNHTQQHQSQAPRHMRVLRHHNSFDPGMGGGGGNNATTVSTSNVHFSTSGVNGHISTTTTTPDNVGKLGPIRPIASNIPNSNFADSRSNNNDIANTLPTPLGRNPTGRSPATSIHSLQLQMQSSDNMTSQAPPPSISSFETASSPTVEKRRLFGVRRERSERALGTVVEPSNNDDVRHVFPSHSEVPLSTTKSKSDSRSRVEQSPSPKLYIGQPISSPEGTPDDEDIFPHRRRAKSSWGSNGTVAPSFFSGDSSIPPQSSSRYGSSGLMRHALSSSDLYNSANRGDGLLVVVRNEFNDGDPNFTSLPPPPRKTKTNAFSNTSGVNSLGMETGRSSRGRKNSNEKKEKDGKSRKRSRSKSKSKSKADETMLDDPQPSFLDMGSGRNVILTFEGDQEVVWDGEPVSTIGLPPKLKVSSSGRHRGGGGGHDRIRDAEPVRTINHGYNSYRHPYGYQEPAYSPIVESSPSPLTSVSASPLTSSPSPYRHGRGEDSFLELSRGHESVDLTHEDLRFARY